MNVLIPIAQGTEEMEAVVLIDVLRRAGLSVTVASVSEAIVEASRGVRLVADVLWDELVVSDFDVLLLPGGLGGTEAFMKHEGIQMAIREFAANDKWFGCICAAALALHSAGVLAGRSFTCYPGVEAQLPQDVQPIFEPVVVDGRLITSQGPGTAFEFALEVVTQCVGIDCSNAVRSALLLG